ncbi:MAG TPA: divalent metal cation transporter [Phenylobacterium sp.]|jgi:Mn2+/Fe2+ NRAMP family transporter|nr:divalent metal cation transporter [Phenylobacterium sp.]
MPPPSDIAFVELQGNVGGLTDVAAATRARFAPTRWLRLRIPAAAALLVGPGALAMLGENDGPSMLSYATSGATYGLGFLLPFIIVTFAAAYVVQEMAMRLGAVTRRGYGELVFQRFGRFWGWASAADLAITNLITLVTEVIAIRLGMGFFGVPPWAAVACAVLLVAMGSWGGRYSTWERLAAGLAAFNLLFVAVAIFARPSADQILHAVATWGPAPKTTLQAFLLILASNIGATVTPWMLFFQQSASVDKGMGRRDIRRGRQNTAIGAVIAAVTGCAALLAATPLFAHHVDMSRYQDGAGFAEALRPIIGAPGAALFALGLVEAGAVAMLTISASTAYSLAEMISGAARSFNASPRQAPLFHTTNVGIAILAGAVVLIPGAPLLTLSLNANLLATILMPAALVFLLMMSGDRQIMGGDVNSRTVTVLGIAIAVLVAAAGSAYAAVGFLSALGIHSF